MVVSTTPLRKIMGNQDEANQIARRAIQLADHHISYKSRTAVKFSALSDFLIYWEETEYLPPPPDSIDWRMHFLGSKMHTGLGAGIILTSPKAGRLQYLLQIQLTTSNKMAEYEVLTHGLRLAREMSDWCILFFHNSHLVLRHVIGEWDARDTNMASYLFLVHQLTSGFEG